MVTDTSPPLTGPDETTVSWQSAWFAIVAIAMNSMSSPNGMVLSFPSSWGEALRSSPIISLFDAVELSLFWLLAVLLTGESPRVAARRVARVRFRDTVVEAGGQQNADGGQQSLSRLRNRFWVTQAALTQVMKLFSFRGVFGFQECAAFYLYSWAVSQALILAAEDGWQAQPLPPLPPGPVRAFLSQGILPYVPLHVWAVIQHTSWLGEFADILGDFTLDGDLRKDPVSSVLWVLGIMLLVAVVPFIIVDVDSNLENGVLQIQLAALGVPPQSYNSAFIWLDMSLCAFTKQTRDAIAGTIPLTLFITGSLQVCLLFICPSFPEENIEKYFATWSYHIGTALLLALAHFQLPSAQKLSTRYVWVRRLQQLREILRVYVLPVVGITSVLVCAVTLRTKVLVYLTVFAVYLALLWSRRSEPAASPFASPPPTPSLNGPRGKSSFPVSVAGYCFVGLNLVWSLLWCWQIWDKIWPECTSQPRWTQVFG
ncbi:hypothetical protein PG996_006794 [Apiospora saccharicola]|uniref:Uncharacterized protein n=1 Tax=Apiospora saccharicola TaxID=335842 RepID=A0ABR1V901_9PEZI